jgi:hypothetical protein
MFRLALFAAAVIAAVSCAGCFSPLYMHDDEYSGKSARQQEALNEALKDAIDKILPRPAKIRDKDANITPTVVMDDITKLLREKTVGIEVAFLYGGREAGAAQADERFIRNALTAFLIQHAEARIVPAATADYIMVVNVQAFGVDADVAYFPIEYIPIYSGMSVDAKVQIYVFVYHRETNRPVFTREIQSVKRYSRYSVFGFAF